MFVWPANTGRPQWVNATKRLNAKHDAVPSGSLARMTICTTNAKAVRTVAGRSATHSVDRLADGSVAVATTRRLGEGGDLSPPELFEGAGFRLPPSGKAKPQPRLSASRCGQSKSLPIPKPPHESGSNSRVRGSPALLSLGRSSPPSLTMKPQHQKIDEDALEGRSHLNARPPGSRLQSHSCGLLLRPATLPGTIFAAAEVTLGACWRGLVSRLTQFVEYALVPSDGGTNSN